MTDDLAPRVGVVRPTRTLLVVAEIDARVIRAELERRLGPITLDLRIDGERNGPWSPLGHAAWPADIDAALDAGALWPKDGPRLPALTARTIDPDAAAVRADMLRHLGIVPDGPFALDDELLARLDPSRIRPTDLWLVARAASDVTVADPDVRALAHTGDLTPLDDAFDRAAADLLDQEAITERLDRGAARLVGERDELRRRLAAAEEQAMRDQADMRDRLDAAQRDLEVWRERAERAELQRTLDEP